VKGLERMSVLNGNNEKGQVKEIWNIQQLLQIGRETKSLMNPKQRHTCVALSQRYGKNALNGLAEGCSEDMV
jgi:hypothetical protein